MENILIYNYDSVTVDLAFSLVGTPFFGQIYQTRELMLFLKYRAATHLKTAEDYLKEYENGGYYSYKDFDSLLQSEMELPSFDLSLEDIKNEIGKTIWCLPCGYYLQSI